MAPFTTGWVYNLHDSNVVSRAQTVIAIAVSFPVIASVFYSVRIGLRIRAKQLGFDDLAATCSLGLAIAYSTTTIIQTRWGLGLNLDDIPAQDVETFSQLQYAGGPIYCLAVLGFKLSLLFAYFRIAGDIRYYARILYVAIALVSINQILFAFLLSFACDPIAKQWEPTLPGSCINQLASYFETMLTFTALGGTSLGLDLIIIILPFPALARLHLSRSRKLIVAALFAFGFFITVIQIIRIFYIANLQDYTNSEKIIEWSIVEINSGIIVASVPTMGKILQKVADIRKRSSSAMPIIRNSADGSLQEKSRQRDSAQIRESIIATQNHLRSGCAEDSPQSLFTIYDSASLEPSTKEADAESGQASQGILKTTEVIVEMDRAKQAMGPPSSSSWDRHL